MRKAVRILGAIGLVGTIALVIMGFRGKAAITAIYESNFRLLSSLPDSLDLDEGRRWSVVNGCRDCHGDDLGGAVMIDAPPFFVVAPNLTGGRGGVAGSYGSIEDWDRAIRYRIRPDGTGLLPMMPSENYHRMSDSDVASIIASVRAAPPVDRELPSTKVRLMGLPIAGAGVLHPPEHQVDAPSGPTPPAGSSAEYGEYLARLMCVECHGDDLQGGPTPGGGPTAPGLSAPGLWSQDAFVAAVAQGVAPGGRRLAEEMPSAAFSRLTQTELLALRAFFATLPSPEGGR